MPTRRSSSSASWCAAACKSSCPNRLTLFRVDDVEWTGGFCLERQKCHGSVNRAAKISAAWRPSFAGRSRKTYGDSTPVGSSLMATVTAPQRGRRASIMAARLSLITRRSTIAGGLHVAASASEWFRRHAESSAGFPACCASPIRRGQTLHFAIFFHRQSTRSPILPGVGSSRPECRAHFFGEPDRPRQVQRR